MMPQAWDLAVVLVRAGIYFSVAAALGGLFALFVFRRSDSTGLWRYLRWSCLFGLLLSGLALLLRSGAMVGSAAAMFDPTFLSIILHSPVGESAFLRSLGFALVLLGSFGLRRSGVALRRTAVLLLLAGGVALPWSFTLAGHTLEQGLPTRLALALHVFAMSLWVGSFYPLLHLMKDTAAAANLKLFGRAGSGIVGLLVCCGLWLSLVLLEGDLGGLLSHGYGRLLGAKIALLGLLLLLAASNKWYWVPRVTANAGAPGLQRALSRSIQGEWLVGIAIFLLTGALATLTSPGHGAH